VSPKSAF